MERVNHSCVLNSVPKPELKKLNQAEVIPKPAPEKDAAFSLSGGGADRLRRLNRSVGVTSHKSCILYLTGRGQRVFQNHQSIMQRPIRLRYDADHGRHALSGGADRAL